MYLTTMLDKILHTDVELSNVTSVSNFLTTLVQDDNFWQ